MCQTSTSVNAANTLTNTTAGVAAAPSGNTSAPIQPTNTSIPTTPSGGKGSGSTCAAGNCTSGTPPPVDWYVGWCIRPVPSTPDVCIFEHVSNQQAAGNSDIRTR